MRPGDTAGELPQEQRGRDRPAGHVQRGADVREIRHTGLQGRPVLIDQRQPPQPFTGCLSRPEQLTGKRVIGGEQAGRPAAQRNRDRTGERRQVNDRVRREAGRVGKPVRKHKAALGIGVEHLDGGSAPAGDDITGPHRGTTDHVLREAEQTGDPVPHAHCRQGRHGREHGSRPRHIRLHRGHGRRGLQRQAAGIEGDPLAHQRHMPAA